MKIQPKTPCLVTGASSGIGRDIALELGRRGCRVALVARSEGPLQELVEAIEKAGGEGLALTADVRDEAAVKAAVETAVERFGSLRLLVANAGLGRYAKVEDQPAEHVETTILTNYVGMTHTVRHALPHLLQAAPSHIVGVTSSAGLIPHHHGSAYCASKAASNMYLAALRLEVFERGVGVSWVCPGLVETPFVETAALDTEKHLPLLARKLVPPLNTAQVTRAVIKAVEGNKSEVVLPPILRFFAWTRRLMPRTTDWLNRKTG